MHCLDCALRNEPATTAVACCRHCGAGVCLDHAAIMLNNHGPVGLMPAAAGHRIISCLSCSPSPRSVPAQSSARRLRIMRRSPQDA